MKSLTIRTYKGQQIIPFIDELAKLRIEVFREYPYLYDGNLSYEEKYLKTYTQCDQSIMVVAFDDQTVVGASTAIPLKDETNECQQPFIKHNYAVDTIFYLGESILLPDYRGNNIYHQFFTAREAAAKDYGATLAAFCAVDRKPNDTRKPAGYQPLDPIWEHFGYEKHPELIAFYEWKEIDRADSTAKPLTFWLKSL